MVRAKGGERGQRKEAGRDRADGRLGTDGASAWSTRPPGRSGSTGRGGWQTSKSQILKMTPSAIARTWLAVWRVFGPLPPDVGFGRPRRAAWNGLQMPLRSSTGPVDSADARTSSQLPFISPPVILHWWGNFRLQLTIGLRSPGSISSWMSSRIASRE